jgi:hypothetical protein
MNLAGTFATALSTSAASRTGGIGMRSHGVVLVTVLALTLAVAAAAADKIPANVMTTLTTKFPQAHIDKWSKEKEDGKTVYDIEFRQDGRKFEADIFADGTIHNWEQQIPQADLPQSVLQTVNRKFPGAVVKEIMAVTDVQNAVEHLQGYEIVVARPHKKDVEMTVAADGRILEGPGAEK